MSLPYSNNGPIPTARIDLEHVCQDLLNQKFSDRVGVVPEIRRIIETMKRKPAIRIAPAKLKGLDEEDKADLRQFAAAHPELTQLELAQRFNTGPGRISEALNYQ